MATTDSLPVPKKNADFRLRVFIEDTSGDPASSFTNANSTISQDDTSFVDCTNEVAFVGNGYGYIDLTSSETNCDGLVYRFECDEGSFQVEICPEEAGDIRVNATQLGGTNYATAVTALVASFWNALTSGLTTNGSIGKLLVDNLNAAVGTVSTNVSTLLTRLTSARAVYLDNLNVGGAVASQASVDDIPTNSEFAAAFPTNFGSLSIDSSGRVRTLDVVANGTAQAGDTITITLANSESSTDNLLDGCFIVLTGGTGAKQCNRIESYNGSTKLCQLDRAWAVTPDNTTTYAVFGCDFDSGVHNQVGDIASAVISILEDTGTTLPGTLADIKGATFDTATDSLEALRNRGDAAWVTATGFATSSALAAITGTNGALIGSEADGYPAQIEFTVDGANTRDEYTVSWFKNLTPLSAGITSPTIQVVKRADGTDLIAEASLTQIGSTGTYRFNTTTEGQRLTEGEAAIVIVTATIDGSERTWKRLISRDAEAA